MSNDDQRLVDALRQWAKGGPRPDFPFDDRAFTLNMAADTIARRPSEAELLLGADYSRDPANQPENFR